jgi:hypothetical protein
MPGNDPVLKHTLQQEIDDLREQAMLLPPGRKRNRVLARADALEVTMKAFLGSISGSATAAAGYALIIRLPNRTGDETIGRHPRRIPRLQCRVAYRALETIQLPRRGHRLSALVDSSAGASAMRVGHGGALYRFSRDSATRSWSDLESADG